MISSIHDFLYVNPVYFMEKLQQIQLVSWSLLHPSWRISKEQS